MASTTGIKAAAKTERQISAEIMKDVMEFVPNDGFRLSEECLGQNYVVTKIIPTEFNSKKSFIAVLKNSERTINVSASLLKTARVLGKAIDFPAKQFNGHKNVVLRSDAQSIWDNSEYMHSEQKMSKDDSFTLPAEITLQGAVVKELDGKPRVNPFLFQGFRKVADVYRKQNKFPTWDDFCAELKKGGDARIKDLPVSSDPIPAAGVDLNALTSITYNLVVSDLVAVGE